jgi:hypothetical protein
LKRSKPGPAARLGPLLKECLAGQPAFSANPIGDWTYLVGEQVARYTYPKSLKKKVLVIAAYDPVWKHHLEQLKEVLAERINAGRPDTIVEEIVIRVGEIPESAPELNPAHKSLEKIRAARPTSRKRAKTPTRKLTPEEQKLVKNLPDPDLRELATRLLKRIPIDDREK